MNGFALLVATAVMGVDYGWQPDAEGQLEYIIQIEPVTLIALREGRDIVSQIDPYVQNVRRFRIRVGTEPVPRRGLPPRRPAEKASPPAPPGVQYGWQTDQDQVEFIVQISPDRLEKLRSGEEISGQIPTGLHNVVRLRVRSGTGTVPTDELPSASGAASSAAAAGGARPAPKGSVSPTGEDSQAAGQPPTTASADATGSSTTREAASGNAVASKESGTAAPQTPIPPQGWQPDPRQLPAAGQPTDPRPGTVSPTDGATNAGSAADAQRSSARVASPPPTAGGQSALVGNPRQGVVDRPPGDLLYRETPRKETPLSSLALPGIDSGQTDQAAGPGTAERQSSVYGQRALSTELTNLGAAAVTDAPNQFEPSQPAGPPATYTADPRREFSPYASNTTSSTAAADGQYFGISDNLASALGYEPWPNRVVSYDVDVTPPPSPQDFWSSLSETAHDPSLAYLEDDADSAVGDGRWWPLTLAILALFASMGGNLYMGWIVAGTYRKYLDLADELNEEGQHQGTEDEREEHAWVRRRSRREQRAAGV